MLFEKKGKNSKHTDNELQSIHQTKLKPNQAKVLVIGNIKELDKYQQAS